MARVPGSRARAVFSVTTKHTFSEYCNIYLSLFHFTIITLLENLNLLRRHLLRILPTSSLNKTSGQVSRIGGHSLFHRDQLINVPLRPHKSSTEELCLWAGKPNTEVAWQSLWMIASLAPVRTSINSHGANITYHLPTPPSHSGHYL